MPHSELKQEFSTINLCIFGLSEMIGFSFKGLISDYFHIRNITSPWY